MCGIVGFTGTGQAAPILLDGLSKLEYRGYDSAGMAILNDHTGKIDVVKAKGRLKILAEKTDAVSGIPDGPLTENPPKLMPIPISVTIRRW